MSVAVTSRIPEFAVLPPALESQTVAELALQVSEMKAEIVALSETVAAQEKARRSLRRPVDPRKAQIAFLKARYPNLNGSAIALALDNADRPELKPLDAWTAATGLRLWHELWRSKDHRKIQHAVKKYIHGVRPLRA